MNSKHLVAEELLPILDNFPPLQFSRASLPQIRAGQAEFLGERPSHPGVDVDEYWVERDAGIPAVRILLYRPSARTGPRPALLHIHGGGFVVGSPEMNDTRNAGLATELGCIIASVDYRLAPEARHVEPVEDCYAALRWLYHVGPSLGVDPDRIAVGGESAGGGLAAGVVLMARDRAEVPVIAQMLVYPMLDDREPADGERNPVAGEFVWTPELNRFGWNCLLGEIGSAEVSPYAAPARAADVSGLPQTFIGVGSLDLFVDQDVVYAMRLLRAGVSVECHIVPGAFHGFDAMSEGPLAETFAASYRAALRRAMFP